jgi:DNA-directed RNA polymerase subunit L
MKINSIGSDAIQVQIDGEDYSVADIVHKELLSVKHVKFAGVAPPHPLIKTLSIQLHTDGSAGPDANELLKEAVTNALERMEEIMDATKKAFPEAIKPTVSHPPSSEPQSKEVPATVTEPPKAVEVSETKTEDSTAQPADPSINAQEKT